jgi:hypothetical protein
MTAAAPLVAPEVDLRDFDFVPIFRRRLFASKFHHLASASEWRAGFILWLKSWDEVPAGSLPNDDRELCALAELGRDLRDWRKVKKWALHGWLLCDDGRLYHPIVAEIALEAWERKQANRRRTEAASAARRDKRYVQRDVQREPHVTRSTKNRTRTEYQKPESTAARVTHAGARENGHDKDIQNQLDDPVGRSAPLAPSAPLKEHRKELLRQKVMRFAHATMKADDRQAAFIGILGEDADHSAQWWLDTLDQAMRKARWDDAT